MKAFTPLLLSLLTSLLLSGCQPSPSSPSRLSSQAVAEPEVKLADYLAIDCSDVWQTEADAAMRNPLYWLRAIDCAERLSPAQARAEAHRWPVKNWSGAFKQGVLMANGNITPMERRNFVTRLDDYSSDFPASVRPLIQLWRSNQAAQLDLSETRSRYTHLQQSSDVQLDQLRQQQITLRQQLSDTQHKLERLTDIERQLSTRKAPDVSDSTHVPAASQSEDQ
ncbi:two-component system QseEF-associated lipoprotein QseG [Pantoea sp. LMR881]|uniref:two-component system QseEF-associated lipoprotein QseG n=1 Tax=Pantoea sp. LMR881 TaxID=3014336 RepID=UPI0022AEE494|nr:two-component system QseEF-associated lipoprotein QseG [Pantoea sp. LMR881]MCZ4060448.1 two-component system QseEF-associated lipoprotein QseG [Pantoea sp. LMR881]